MEVEEPLDRRGSEHELLLLSNPMAVGTLEPRLVLLLVLVAYEARAPALSDGLNPRVRVAPRPAAAQVRLKVVRTGRRRLVAADAPVPDLMLVLVTGGALEPRRQGRPPGMAGVAALRLVPPVVEREVPGPGARPARSKAR